MKTPKARKLPSGKYFIQLRLGGESISVSDWNEKTCVREAQRLKAEYLAGKRLPPPPPEPEPEKPKGPTLKKAIDDYIEARQNVLSPATIRGYRTIQKSHFPQVMHTPLEDIPDEIWQTLINQEAKKYSPKTLKNTWGLIKPLIEKTTHHELPNIAMPALIPYDTPFLTPDEIEIFVKHAKESEYAVPLLLALMSCRMSELMALDWKDIPQKTNFIKIRGAVVQDENHKFVEKEQNKNETSTRPIPILIPELAEAIARDRQPSGPVLTRGPKKFRNHLTQLCTEAGITVVTPHGLRHSFASLAYHLEMPKKIAMEIGGWKNAATMEKIYTHVAQSDIEHYKTKMADFYSGKLKKDGENANKNANKK